MRLFRTCALLLVAFAGSSDAASTHAQTAAKMKQLRVGVKRDVDDSEADADANADSEDSDDDVVSKGPAPAPAAAAAPSGAPAPGPLTEHLKEDEEVQMQKMMSDAADMLEDHGIDNARSKHKQELAGLMWIEETLEEKLDSLNDEEYKKKIEKEEKPVADETSPGLANMLGEMREDMHEYALPFYKKVLKEKIEEVQKDQHQLVLAISDDTKEAEKKEKEEKEPEKEKEEKKKEEIEEPAPAPVEEEKKGGRSVGNNTIFIAAAAVAVLAVVAFILSRRGSTPRGA